MQNKKNLIISAVGLLITMGIVSFVSANQFDNKFKKQKFSPEKQEQRQEVKLAIENNDYEAWQKTKGTCPFAEKITEENFDKFAEMHNLKKDNKFDEAKIIAEELGIKKEKHFNKKGSFCKNSEQKEAIKEAIENNDYATWKELDVKCPFADKITVDNFSKFAEMHNLKKDGKFDEAKIIAEELGIERFGKNRKFEK